MIFFINNVLFSTENFIKVYKIVLCFIVFSQIYFYSAAQPVRSKLSVQLLLNTQPGPQNTADGAVAFFADNFSSSIGNEDSYKFTNPDENLAINSNGTMLSMDGRPNIRRCDTVKLAMWTFRQKSYFLEFEGNNFKPNIKAVIKDNYLQRETSIDLASTTLLPFRLTSDSASFSKNRFSIIFRAARVFSASNEVKLKAKFKENSSFALLSNPVTGNTISLLFNNMKKGRYEVNLYSSSGQIVHSGIINYDGISSTQTFAINRRVHKGMYNLLLTCENQVITKSVLFQ